MSCSFLSDVHITIWRWRPGDYKLGKAESMLDVNMNIN